MTCFVIHVSLLSLHIFRNSCFTKRPVVYHPLTNLSFAAVGFLFIIETLIIILLTIHPSLLLKYAIRRVILYLLARDLGKNTQRIL